VGERLDWLDESVGAMRAIMAGEKVTSPQGGRYAFDGLAISPLPVQKRLPIMIGGNGRTKTLRTVARYADMWNGFGLPGELKELHGVLREHCAEAGRDPAEIDSSVNLWMVIRDSESEAKRVWARAMDRNLTPVAATIEPARPLLTTPEKVAERLLEYVEAGCTTALVEMPAPYDMETLERLAREVRPLVERGTALT
jgi:alkanesulfonate monooxygenase SsuD/methylene tetrahydromethanopterin reductase-like flavin-dependent oxidoreductase (luciferase family)